MSPRRLLVGTAVGGALVVSLSACLGGGSGSNAGGGGGGGTVLTAAAVLEKTSQQSGAVTSVSMEYTVDGTVAGQNTHVHATGGVRLKPAYAMRLTMDQLSAGGRNTGPMQMRLLGETMYMKSPAFASLAGGKPWIKISLSQVGAKAGMDFSSIMKQSQQYGPGEQTKMYTGSKDAHKIGTEVVNGVTTTHYTGTVSIQDALAKFSGDTRTTLDKAYATLGADKITFDVWVDGQSLPRKLISKTGGITATVLYTDYNKPVSVTAPAPSEVGTLPGFG